MVFPLLATYIYIKQKCNFTVNFNNISTHFYFIIHDPVLKEKKNIITLSNYRKNISLF